VNGSVVTNAQFSKVAEPDIYGSIPNPALAALQNMATDPTNFYDLPNPTSLIGIFDRIASDLAGGSARIVQ
jgi:hypothetical protein